MAQRNGTSMFPREVVQKPRRMRLQPNAFPLLPLEGEGRLNDLPLRENFIEQVLPVEKRDRAYYRWPRMLDEEPRQAAWSLSLRSRTGKFHTAQKLTREAVHGLLRAMAHSPKHYTEMGRLVADAGKWGWEELSAEYGAILMEGLAVMGTRGQACERPPALDGLSQEPSLQ
jgi:hypothetical protein